MSAHVTIESEDEPLEQDLPNSLGDTDESILAFIDRVCPEPAPIERCKHPYYERRMGSGLYQSDAVHCGACGILLHYISKVAS